MVTRSEVFPTRWLKPADLKGEPCVLEIKRSKLEQVKFNGKAETKLILAFAGTDKALIVNATNFDSLVEITGQSDSDNWPGHAIEAYPSTVPIHGEEHACIRLRPPEQADMLAAAKAPKLPPAPKAPPKSASDMDDDIPF
jgi:hypothetical protein